MLGTPSHNNLNKIVVLNPKGGCGKSTLVTNLAAIYARSGATPAIMDYDPQGSTMAWLARRPKDRPKIHGVAAYKNSMQATRSWQLRVPNNTATLIIDSPASLSHDDLRELTREGLFISPNGHFILGLSDSERQVTSVGALARRRGEGSLPRLEHSSIEDYCTEGHDASG